MTRPTQILIADDDPSILLLLRETLQDAGYEVRTASDGDELVRMAQDEPPDLMLIDLMMPLMDGFEAIRQLRNDTRTSHLPMLILTARSTSSEVVVGFDSGADDYIVKPYDLEILLARIRRHLQRAATLPVHNPLTGLPGNILLIAELERQMQQGIAFALVYVDLDNFKAFNDAYGFARGDRAIHLLASVLTEVAPHEDFLGHIGGDDFALIHYGGREEDLCQRIIDAFDARVRELYDAVDLQRGYLRSVDRHGVPRQFGMLSLSIAVVNNSGHRFASVDAMSRVAAELKHAAKHMSGNSYVIDQRVAHQAASPERRGGRRPAALLICGRELLRGSVSTSLRHQGYRPLIAADAIAAQGLLARTPDPVLMVADMADEQAWAVWKQCPEGTPLIALVFHQAEAQEALARGAIVTLEMNDNLVEFTDQLMLYLPPATVRDPSSGTSMMFQALTERNRDLEREANEDGLTLLANHWYANRRGLEFLAQMHRQGRLLTVIMADLDHFKQVNDQWGHLVGNAVLRAVADIMRDASQPSDLVARYGGEEFLLLLPDTSLEDGCACAEEIRVAVEAYNWQALHPQMNITVSLGVVEASAWLNITLPSPERQDDDHTLDAAMLEDELEQVIAEADRRLHLAKAGGRNCVVCTEA
ncbi:diguanylate cyclase [Candidatus Chloroploca sp. Khr17]|uniref:diguanylate cyclase n=1 Tax=Candidatus Chloroploca sp. Khr17 TaxID=2496869 RepID=UPI00101E15A1|nr:diguanylate cyclase [Candidatus Chloroploca sp. Khr17]